MIFYSRAASALSACVAIASHGRVLICAQLGLAATNRMQLTSGRNLMGNVHVWPKHDKLTVQLGRLAALVLWQPRRQPSIRQSGADAQPAPPGAGAGLEVAAASTAPASRWELPVHAIAAPILHVGSCNLRRGRSVLNSLPQRLLCCCCSVDVPGDMSTSVCPGSSGCCCLLASLQLLCAHKS